MQVRALWAALVNRVEKRALRVLREKKAKGRKHRLNSHSDSVYVWALLDQKYGVETSQEMRQRAANERGDRSRVNGFVTVDMILRKEKVA